MRNVRARAYYEKAPRWDEESAGTRRFLVEAGRLLERVVAEADGMSDVMLGPLLEDLLSVLADMGDATIDDIARADEGSMHELDADWKALHALWLRMPHDPARFGKGAASFDRIGDFTHGSRRG